MADQRTEGAVRTILRRLRIPALGVVVVFVYAVTGYMILGFRLIDAMYMSALALTTAGFTPVGDLDETQKAFTITIAAFGATLFLVLLAIVTTTITEGQLGIRTRRRRMERKVAALSDHFIVCAYGRVGRSAAREFEAEGKPFVVIDRKEELEDDMRSDGVLYIIGDPAADGVLRAAGLERARGIVCAVDDDSTNVFITVVARSLNPKIFIVARASDPGTPEVLYRAGADRVISPYVQSGGHMGRLALRPRVRDYLEVAAPDQSKLRLDEILIDVKSSMAGRMLQDIVGEAIPLLLKRPTGDVIPNPPRDTVISVGDLLLVFGEAGQLQTIEGD